jgi:hypothetical protein
MAIQDRMFKEIQLWKASGKNKADFIRSKNYSKAKFEYWISKHNKANVESLNEGFTEIPLEKEKPSPNVEPEKLIKIELPTGIKITIYK